jgi:hypothetical protein
LTTPEAASHQKCSTTLRKTPKDVYFAVVTRSAAAVGPGSSGGGAPRTVLRGELDDKYDHSSVDHVVRTNGSITKSDFSFNLT